ncbi:MAG: DUF3810 domain-containing protein [Flavobacteriaceae bacterium]|nr:DUF3810 domain-containing protein [Flavobacteriaceae bacterium]
MIFKINYNRWLLLLVLLVCAILIHFLKFHPPLIEQYYSQNFYPKLFYISSSVLGQINVSVGDFLILLVLLSAPLFIYRVIVMLKNHRFLFIIINLFTFLCSLYILFHITWGLNYHRVSLNKKLGYDLKYTDEELAATTKSIITEINALHSTLTLNDSLPITVDYSQKEINELLENSKSFHFENNFPKSFHHRLYIKSSFWSLVLSYMGFAGYLNPITLESQVNKRMPALSYITTAAHEMTHQMGIAPENEANFLSFKATTQHNNPYVQYAGYLMGLRYTIGEYYINKPKLARELYNQINPGIKKNISEIARFWRKYQNPFEKYFEKTYNQYLKAQGQRDGIETYSQMVAYLVDYYDSLSEQ